MNAKQLLALALDPSRILAARGLRVDPWQRDVLLSRERQLLLCCCRQAGKSTVVSALALHHALFEPASLTLILSPGQRQSAETFKKVRDHYRALDRPIKATHETQLRLELANGSRILCLPGVEGTVRCYSPSLVIIDEAARVSDDLYRAIRPMLAVSRGRLIALSTPFGRKQVSGTAITIFQDRNSGSRHLFPASPGPVKFGEAYLARMRLWLARICRWFSRIEF